jgi:hypothetical protein
MRPVEISRCLCIRRLVKSCCCLVTHHLPTHLLYVLVCTLLHVRVCTLHMYRSISTSSIHWSTSSFSSPLLLKHFHLPRAISTSFLLPSRSYKQASNSYSPISSSALSTSTSFLPTSTSSPHLLSFSWSISSSVLLGSPNLYPVRLHSLPALTPHPLYSCMPSPPPLHLPSLHLNLWPTHLLFFPGNETQIQKLDYNDKLLETRRIRFQ